MSWGDEGGQANLTFRSRLQNDLWGHAWGLIAGWYRVSVAITEQAARGGI